MGAANAKRKQQSILLPIEQRLWTCTTGCGGLTRELAVCKTLGKVFNPSLPRVSFVLVLREVSSPRARLQHN